MNIGTVIAFISGSIVLAVGASTLLNNYLSSKRGAFITSDMWNEAKTDIHELQMDVAKLKENASKGCNDSDFKRMRSSIVGLKEATDKHEVLIQEIEAKIGKQMDAMKELFTERIDSVKKTVEDIKKEVSGGKIELSDSSINRIVKKIKK